MKRVVIDLGYDATPGEVALATEAAIQVIEQLGFTYEYDDTSPDNLVTIEGIRPAECETVVDVRSLPPGTTRIVTKEQLDRGWDQIVGSKIFNISHEVLGRTDDGNYVVSEPETIEMLERVMRKILPELK